MVKRDIKPHRLIIMNSETKHVSKLHWIICDVMSYSIIWSHDCSFTGIWTDEYACCDGFIS